MKTDALNRRVRFARPQPTVKRLVLTKADLLIFEAIQRHGPLPTPYLYAFTKSLRKDYTHLQNRLTEFYNGDDGGPYLLRPPQQFAGYEARYQPLVYALAPRAHFVLAAHDRLTRYASRRSDPFLHQLMQACVGASFELSAPDSGLNYIHWETIFAHGRFPELTKAAPNPMAIAVCDDDGTHTLVPDDLFGVRHPDAGYRFFAVEIDRDTESIERRDPAQTAFGRKIEGYLDIMRRQTFKTWWGIPNLSLLTVTTNDTHAQNLVQFVKQRADPVYWKRFGFIVERSFGANWCVPRSTLEESLAKSWATAAGPIWPFNSHSGPHSL